MNSPAQAKTKMSPLSMVLMTLIISLFFVLFNRHFKKPMQDKLYAQKQQLETMYNEVQKKRATLAQLANSRKTTVVDSRGLRQLIDRYTEANAHLSKVIQHLSHSEENAFYLGSITTDKPSQLGPYTRTPLQLDAEATFVSIGQFLERLEDSPLLTELESFEINRKTTDLKLCSVKLKLASYQKEN
jgi:Tfp pilus assembly protein PilO